MNFKQCYNNLDTQELSEKDNYFVYHIDNILQTIVFTLHDTHIQDSNVKEFYSKIYNFILSQNFNKMYFIIENDRLKDYQNIAINAIGFENIDSFDNDNKTFSVWNISLSLTIPNVENAFDHTYENEDVIENLHDAITLYLHEDNLNWTKLGLLVSFIFAILTAFFVVLDQPNTPANLLLSNIIISIGLIITYIFSEKLKSGIYYMSKHKEKVKKIEQIIQFFKPHHVPLINVLDKNVSNVSTTVQLMLLMPKLAYVIWPICFVMSILNYLS